MLPITEEKLLSLLNQVPVWDVARIEPQVKELMRGYKGDSYQIEQVYDCYAKGESTPQGCLEKMKQRYEETNGPFVLGYSAYTIPPLLGVSGEAGIGWQSKSHNGVQLYSLSGLIGADWALLAPAFHAGAKLTAVPIPLGHSEKGLGFFAQYLYYLPAYNPSQNGFHVVAGGIEFVSDGLGNQSMGWDVGLVNLGSSEEDEEGGLWIFLQVNNSIFVPRNNF